MHKQKKKTNNLLFPRAIFPFNDAITRHPSLTRLLIYLNFYRFLDIRRELSYLQYMHTLVDSVTQRLRARIKLSHVQSYFHTENDLQTIVVDMLVRMLLFPSPLPLHSATVIHLTGFITLTKAPSSLSTCVRVTSSSYRTQQTVPPHPSPCTANAFGLKDSSQFPQSEISCQYVFEEMPANLWCSAAYDRWIAARRGR